MYISNAIYFKYAFLLQYCILNYIKPPLYNIVMKNHIMKKNSGDKLAGAFVLRLIWIDQIWSHYS